MNNQLTNGVQHHDEYIDILSTQYYLLRALGSRISSLDSLAFKRAAIQGGKSIKTLIDKVELDDHSPYTQGSQRDLDMHNIRFLYDNIKNISDSNPNVHQLRLLLNNLGEQLKTAILHFDSDFNFSTNVSQEITTKLNNIIHSNIENEEDDSD